MSAISPPLVSDLANESLDWMADAPGEKRPDVSDDLWAYSLATFVDGVAITPKGYDVTGKFDGRGR